MDEFDTNKVHISDLAEERFSRPSRGQIHRVSVSYNYHTLTQINEQVIIINYHYLKQKRKKKTKEKKERKKI